MAKKLFTKVGSPEGSGYYDVHADWDKLSLPALREIVRRNPDDCRVFDNVIGAVNLHILPELRRNTTFDSQANRRRGIFDFAERVILEVKEIHRGARHQTEDFNPDVHRHLITRSY